MVDIDKAVRELMDELALPPAVCAVNKKIGPADVAGRLEHSLLTAELTIEELRVQCRMARDFRIAAVCVAPYYVAEAASMLTGSNVIICAAVGFPGSLISARAKETDVRACVTLGAREIDLAVNISAVKSGDIARAEKDFFGAAQATGGKAAVKAVFEHGSFDEREKTAVLEMIGRSGVPFIKIQNMTSGHGARAEDIRFVRDVLGGKIMIKIDGGVKTLEQAMELFRAGADRIGLTATKTVAAEAAKELRRFN